MSRKSRINRPTTATPRRDVRPLRYLHVSTNYAWLPVDPRKPYGPVHFVKVGPGLTYRRERTSVAPKLRRLLAKAA
jgi:hypothetical protein